MMSLQHVMRFAAFGWLTITFAIGAKDKPSNDGEWRAFGSDLSFTRYSPLDKINASNVKNLRIVWRRSAVDARFTEKFQDPYVGEYLRRTPIMVNGVLYSLDGVGFVEAFEAKTGKTLWVQTPLPASLKEAAGQSTRGAAYWRNGSSARIFIVRGEYLYAV